MFFLKKQTDSILPQNPFITSGKYRLVLLFHRSIGSLVNQTKRFIFNGGLRSLSQGIQPEYSFLKLIFSLVGHNLDLQLFVFIQTSLHLLILISFAFQVQFTHSFIKDKYSKKQHYNKRLWAGTNEYHLLMEQRTSGRHSILNSILLTALFLTCYVLFVFIAMLLDLVFFSVPGFSYVIYTLVILLILWTCA